MSLNELNWTDVCMLLLIFVTGLVGALRGAVRPVASLAALTVGVLVAGHLAPMLRAERLPFVRDAEDPVALGMALGWVLVLLAAMLAGSLIGRILVRLVTGNEHGRADRLVGLLVGAGRGAIVGALACVALLMFVGQGPVRADVEASRTFDGTRWLVSRADPLMPRSSLQPIRSAIESGED